MQLDHDSFFVHVPHYLSHILTGVALGRLSCLGLSSLQKLAGILRRSGERYWVACLLWWHSRDTLLYGQVRHMIEARRGLMLLPGSVGSGVLISNLALVVNALHCYVFK